VEAPPSSSHDGTRSFFRTQKRGHVEGAPGLPHDAAGSKGGREGIEDAALTHEFFGLGAVVDDAKNALDYAGDRLESDLKTK
jgi:hypothetical protein